MSDLFSSYDICGVLFELGILRRIDRVFSAFIYRRESSPDKRVIALLAGLVSYSTTRVNNVCLDLSNPLACFDSVSLKLDDKQQQRFEDVCSDIRSLLDGRDFAGLFTEAATVSVTAEVGVTAQPLVYSEGRLYMLRYWEAEVVIADSIRNRVGCGVSDMVCSGFNMLGQVYGRFDDYEKTLGQQLAVYTTLRSNFSIITGGPGTGKTTVVSVILAVFLMQNENASIALVAPTGKAQARLKEAVMEELEYLTVSDTIKEQIMRVEFKTLHSLLGLRRNGRATEQSLRYDLVVVDEASMVSVLLFRRLFESLKLSTRIILLGDRDQLAAVEGGAVLSDLCSSVLEPGGYSEEFVRELAEVVPVEMLPPVTSGEPAYLQDVVAPLTYTFRFGSDSGIGRLKDLLQSGSTGFNDFIEHGYREYSDSISLLSFDAAVPSRMRSELLGFVGGWEVDSGNGRVGFLSYLDAESVGEAYRVFSLFRIITPLNKGGLGVEGINELLLRHLGMSAEGCRGLPVMIEKNDYQNMLFNGDIGMYWPDADGVMKVWFPYSAEQGSDKSNGFRAVSPAKLPKNSPAFAMTIHKSQGSGFDSVLLVLPSVNSEILTKELLYTAVTRAKRKITIFGDVDSVISAAKVKTCRISGLVGRFG